MKFGIGIITSGERPLRNEYSALAESGTLIHIHVDKDRRGGAYCRNQVINSLYDAECTHIFLFDDDVWPTREHWQIKFATFMERYGIDFTGTAWPEGPVSGTKDNAIRMPYMTTQFACLTRRCVERIGYFDERFGMYGPEDADYATRAHNDGLTGGEGFLTPAWFNIFIHVEDFYSCFTKSTFPEDVKTQGLNAVAGLMQKKGAAKEGPYIPYGNGISHAT